MEEQLVAQLSSELNNKEIRRLGETLLRVSDANDKKSRITRSSEITLWPNKLNNIERDSLNLAYRARRILYRRGLRSKYISDECFGDLMWDFLLDLFVQDVARLRISVSSLRLAYNVPVGTASEWVASLEKEGLVECDGSGADCQFAYVEITRKGRLAVGSYLDEIKNDW